MLLLHTLRLFFSARMGYGKGFMTDVAEEKKQERRSKNARESRKRESDEIIQMRRLEGMHVPGIERGTTNKNQLRRLVCQCCTQDRRRGEFENRKSCRKFGAVKIIPGFVVSTLLSERASETEADIEQRQDGFPDQIPPIRKCLLGGFKD